MFCKNCGTEISADDKFCKNCGSPITLNATTSETSTQSVEVKSEETNFNTSDNSSETSSPNTSNSFKRVIYRLLIVAFGVLFMSQSLVSCEKKGYECVIESFKPDQALMISKANMFLGIDNGNIGIYVVSFIMLLYLMLLYKSFGKKEEFWKQHLHTNIFIPLTLIITYTLFESFGIDSYKPTNYALICTIISVLIYFLYMKIESETKVKCEQKSFTGGIIKLFIFFLFYAYLLGAIIPSIMGKIY